MNYFTMQFFSQWTHLCWFAINSTLKVHVESLSRFHQFQKANSRGNYDIDSTWKFRCGFDFQNRRNIDEFSTWIFLCHFNVESTQLLYSLFPFYHVLIFSSLGTYSKPVWHCAELMQFQRYWRNHWYWNYWDYILSEFCNNANTYE